MTNTKLARQTRHLCSRFWPRVPLSPRLAAAHYGPSCEFSTALCPNACHDHGECVVVTPADGGEATQACVCFEGFSAETHCAEVLVDQSATVVNQVVLVTLLVGGGIVGAVYGVRAALSCRVSTRKWSYPAGGYGCVPAYLPEMYSNSACCSCVHVSQIGC